LDSRIQDRQWKKLNEIWKVLERTMKWVTIGRSLIIPKTMEEERPITQHVLITSYKLFTGMIGKCTSDHGRREEIWYERQPTKPS
jgi:hypothetical protein